MNLFLVGFLVLFLELACIRWFAAYVIFLQFFTNVVLMASFLGMSCGCLAARSRRDWLRRFPFLALGTVLAALAIHVLYMHWSGLAIEVGHQASPQEVFFGTEDRNPDVARFVVPIEYIAGVFFVLIAWLFVGLGQVLGQAFAATPSRLRGYMSNVGGSLAGIAAFSLIAFLQAPPSVWFAICAAGVGYLLYEAGSLTPTRLLALGALPLVVALPGVERHFLAGAQLRWSPYYAVGHEMRSGGIRVNTIGHQQMVPFEKGGSTYSLIHLLQRHSGGAPFQDVLIIGAGSGNDMDHALRFGVGRVDAVEIDPVIQDIGVRFNPDHPYQDPRVVRHLDDGRHFLRTTDRKYDLVVYALVDSLILHSGYSNIRLESYLFTREAFADVQRVLKPGGTFVTYNYFRQGWIVARVAEMAESVFGCPPMVFSLPYRETLTAADAPGFTVVVAGCNRGMPDAFATRGSFWLNVIPPRNLTVDGFSVRPEERSSRQEDWLKIAPTAVRREEATSLVATDDWPFLYLRQRLVPDLSLRAVVVLGVLGATMIYFFLPARPLQIHSRMFFLGAAFMLLETKAVVQLALLFGSTWLVNSLVFFTVLVMILLANLYVLKTPSVHLVRHYAGLFLCLILGVVVPLNPFLGGGVLWRYVLPCALALGPMLFAAVIFARSFSDEANADQAFGSNIAGSMAGGLCESLSMLLGFRYVLVVAMVFYLLSAWMPSIQLRAARSN